MYDLMHRNSSCEGRGTGGVFSKQVSVLNVEDFENRSTIHSMFESNSGTCWIFANGRKDVSLAQETFSDWVANCKKPAEDALSACMHMQKPLVSVYLLVSASSLQELASLLQFNFSILGPRQSRKGIALICEDGPIVQDLRALARVDVGECCVAGMHWACVKDSICQMLMGREVFDLSTEKHVVSSSDTPVAVPLARMRAWEDINVVGYYECEYEAENASDEMERSRDNFYKGEQPEWLNFYLRHDIERSLLRKLKDEVQQRLESLKGQNFGQERDNRTSIRTVVLHHSPGTGGTTLCRRVLWEFRKTFRCALIQAITNSTAMQVSSLYDFKESHTGPNAILPVLLLVDCVNTHAFRSLCSDLNRSRVRSVILQCRPILSEPLQKKQIYGDAEYHLDRHLSKSEIKQVAHLINQLEPDRDKRTQIIRNVKSNQQILYFGLQLFGQEYNHKLLEKYVVYHLENVAELEVEMLKFCSLVYTYMHVGIPRSCVQSLLSPLEGPFRVSMADISDTTADMIVLNTEGYETYAYEGYRPAHHLIGVEVLHRFQLLETAMQFLDKMVGRRSEYAANILTDIAIRLFTKRDAKVGWDEENVDGDEDIAAEKTSEHAGRVQLRRFSPFITTLMKDEGKFEALELLLVLCEKTLGCPGNAFVWQHLARYLAYEVGEMELPRKFAGFLSFLLWGETYWLHDDSDDGDSSLEKPIDKYTGYEAAVMAIDKAIDQEKDRSIFHTTKGLVYKLQLSPYKARPCSVEKLYEVIRTAQQSFEAFEVAKNCPMAFINWYAMIGKIEVCLDLLAIVKGSEVFKGYVLPADHKKVFREFMDGSDTPKEMRGLDPDQIAFIRGREECIRRTLDDIFECEHLTGRWDKKQRYEYQSAQARGARLRRKFVEVSDCQYTIDLAKKERKTESSPELRRQMVEEMLYVQGEDPYSTWVAFSDKDMSEIARWLKPSCSVQRGRLNTDTETTVLMFVRACVEGRDVATLNGGTKELIAIVNSWCSSKPKSAWAHLFQYMLYFPLPNPICTPDKEVVKQAINCCLTTIRNKQYAPRKSRPRYFFGRGEGIAMIMSAAKISLDYYENTTNFWRSKRVMASLIRLKGTKHKFGQIMYQGIEVSFDNELYPKESKDWLWFYLGFTIQGPYAYDPVDQEKYDELRKVDLSTLPDIPLRSSPKPHRSLRNQNRRDQKGTTEHFQRAEIPPRFRSAIDQAEKVPALIPTAQLPKKQMWKPANSSQPFRDSVQEKNRFGKSEDIEATPSYTSDWDKHAAENLHDFDTSDHQHQSQQWTFESVDCLAKRLNSRSMGKGDADRSKLLSKRDAEVVKDAYASTINEKDKDVLDTEVVVSQIHPSINTGQIATVFSSFGIVLKVTKRNAKTAVVLFSTSQGASKAVSCGKVTIGNFRVIVKRADRKAEPLTAVGDYGQSLIGSGERRVRQKRTTCDRGETSVFTSPSSRITKKTPTCEDGHAVLIQNIDPSTQDEDIWLIAKLIDEDAQVVRLSDGSAIATYRDYQTACLAQKQLHGHVLNGTKNLQVKLLPPDEDSRQPVHSSAPQSKAVAKSLDTQHCDQEFNQLLQEEVIIFLIVVEFCNG